jgi:SAM-dependent methyltransferase
MTQKKRGFWEARVLPRLIDLVLDNKEVGAERKKTLAGVKGRVLELGFGSGLNLPFYPDGVETVVGVDPSETSAKLAKKRIAAAPFPVEYLPLEGEELRAEPRSFDAAVSTMTLCTIPDPLAALARVKSALKPGAAFYFLEHGRAPEENVQKWQARWEPIQNTLFGGCSVSRPIDQLILEAGFRFDDLEVYYMRGPKVWSYMFRGVARA